MTVGGVDALTHADAERVTVDGVDALARAEADCVRVDTTVLLADATAEQELKGAERPVLGHAEAQEHVVGAFDPDGQNEPMGQMICVADVEPEGQ